MTIKYQQAGELQTSCWFNTSEPVTLAEMRGRVVLIEVFQMLCPGCVSHGLPQVMRVAETFDPNDVAVIGLHSVFEHHAAMEPVSLQAFLYEYRINFPVGVDEPSTPAGIPKTMAKYKMRGTPTLVLIDRAGRLRKQWFGSIADLTLGAEIAILINESVSNVCAEQGCRIDQGNSTFKAP